MLCVGASPNPRTWIEVRLTDFLAPELNAPGGRDAQRSLSRIALGKQAVCTVEGGHGGRVRSYDRALAICRIGGVSVGELLRRAGVREGGNR